MTRAAEWLEKAMKKSKGLNAIKKRENELTEFAEGEYDGNLSKINIHVLMEMIIAYDADVDRKTPLCEGTLLTRKKDLLKACENLNIYVPEFDRRTLKVGLDLFLYERAETIKKPDKRQAAVHSRSWLSKLAYLLMADRQATEYKRNVAAIRLLCLILTNCGAGGEPRCMDVLRLNWQDCTLLKIDGVECMQWRSRRSKTDKFGVKRLSFYFWRNDKFPLFCPLRQIDLFLQATGTKLGDCRTIQQPVSDAGRQIRTDTISNGWRRTAAKMG